MTNGRDEKGRFIPGQSGNPSGRKSRETEQHYLDLLRKGVSDADARAIIQVAVAKAKTRGGHLERKWLFDYLIGQPVQRVAPTDPSGEYEYLGLGDAEIVGELTRLLDAARARASSAADDGGETSVDSPCAGGTATAAG